tara:strand:+ start:216 stop:497 length:282 start_codon:yes stop_codon:yes gene_type:complete
MTWNNAIKNLVNPNEKVLRDQFRFKFAFSHCKTYDDIFKTLEYLKKYFKDLKRMKVEKHDGNEDDYHQFYIETTDKNKIKKLKKLGFYIDKDE